MKGSSSPEKQPHSRQQSKVQSKIDQLERLKQTDIRDNRTVVKEMDITRLTPHSLEQLLKFIGLRDGEISL